MRLLTGSFEAAPLLAYWIQAVAPRIANLTQAVAPLLAKGTCAIPCINPKHKIKTHKNQNTESGTGPTWHRADEATDRRF